MMIVQKVWSRLLSVQSLTFEARSRAASNTGWNGSGRGVVRGEPITEQVFLFHERGEWVSAEGRQIPFTNVFRWTIEADARCLRLEHLRFGPDRPVFLFDLVAVDEGVLESSAPHLCRDDCYAARMEFDEQSVRLNWTINGPQKAETISYVYQ